MSDGRVSVVIPVFNTEQYLGEAIESVLIQGEALREIVVVDDGSTDGSSAVARRFGNPVRVIRQQNRGPAAARNLGLATVRCEYVAFLDADDLYSPDKFALQIPRLDRRPDVDIVIGQLSRSHLHEDGVDHSLTDHSDTLHPLPMANWSGWNGLPSFTTGIFRRRVFDRVGLPDESMLQAEDWDWFLRAREAGVVLLLHRHVVLNYRQHKGNITRDRKAAAGFVLQAIGRSLARRRRSGDATTPLPPLSDFFETEE